MSKKIILLALAVASMAAFALPAAALAAESDTAVHVVPKPEGTKTIDGAAGATLTGGFGNVVCTANSGTATFESTTTGTFQQTFTGCTLGASKCTTAGQPEETIKTQSLPFHLVTVEHSPATVPPVHGPGVLVTPNAATGQFATFTCGFLGFTVKGNGVIGTITSPVCGAESTEAKIKFSSSATGVQTDKTVVASDPEKPATTYTATEYSLENLGAKASQDAEGTMTLGTKAKLECT